MGGEWRKIKGWRIEGVEGWGKSRGEKRELRGGGCKKWRRVEEGKELESGGVEEWKRMEENGGGGW